MSNFLNTARLIVTLSVSTGSSLAAAQSIDSLNWKAGYNWKYQVIDGWSDREIGSARWTVNNVDRDTYYVDPIGTGGKNSGTLMNYRPIAKDYGEIIRRDGSHVRALPLGDGNYEYFDIKFPLIIGGKWKYTAYYPGITGGANGTRDMSCEVIGQENVKTVAGSFSTYRIDCSGFWRNDGGFNGRVKTSAWYSPDVKWFVKLTDKFWGHSGGLYGNEEFLLVEYKSEP